MTERHRLQKTLPQYAENHCAAFIAGYGIERAEVVAKLTLEKIRASRKSIERRYGAGDDMTCTRHPNYKAIRKPRIACQTCWDIWEAKHKNEKKK